MIALLSRVSALKNRADRSQTTRPTARFASRLAARPSRTTGPTAHALALLSGLDALRILRIHPTRRDLASLWVHGLPGGLPASGADLPARMPTHLTARLGAALSTSLGTALDA